MDEEDLLVPLREESAEVYVKDFEENQQERKNAQNQPEFDESTTPEAPVEKPTPDEEPRRITPIILKAVNDGGDKNKNSSYIVKSPNPNHTEPVVRRRRKKKGRPRKNPKLPTTVRKYGKRGRPSREAIEQLRLQEMQLKNGVKDDESVRLTPKSREPSTEQVGENNDGVRRTIRNRLKSVEKIDAALIDKELKENTKVEIANENPPENSARDRLRKCPQRFAQDYVYARKTRGRPKLKTFCSVKEFCDFTETKPSYIEEGINPKSSTDIALENHIGSIKRKRGRPRIHPPKDPTEKKTRGRPGTNPMKVKREPQYDENGELVKPPRGRPRTRPFKPKREPQYDENGVLIKPPRGRPSTNPYRVKREPQYDENGELVKPRRGRPSANPYKTKREPRYDENGELMKPRRGRPSNNPYKVKSEPRYDEYGELIKPRRGRPSNNPYKVKSEPRYDENGDIIRPRRGRPSNNPYKIKLEPQYDENGMIIKKTIGRPRKHPKKDPDRPKRGRGRPPKYRMGLELEEDVSVPSPLEGEEVEEDEDLCDSSILEPQVNIIEGISSFPNSQGIKMNGSGFDRNGSILDAMHLRKIDRLPCATMESFIAASLSATTNNALTRSSKPTIQIVNDEPVRIDDSDDSDNEENGVVNDSISESQSDIEESTAERISSDGESSSPLLNIDASQVTVVIDADNGDIITTKTCTNSLETQNETVSTQTDQVRDDSLMSQNDCYQDKETEDEDEGCDTTIESSPVKSQSSVAIQASPEIFEIPDEDEDSRLSKGNENEPVEIEDDSSDDENEEPEKHES